MQVCEIKINNSIRIKITKYAFNIVKTSRGSQRLIASYNNLSSFLKDLPQNIIKNSDDIKSINNIEKALNNYLKNTVPELLKLYNQKG